MGKIAEHAHLANMASIKLNHVLRQLRECQSCQEDNESEEGKLLSGEFYVGNSDVDDSDYDNQEEVLEEDDDFID